MNKLSICLLIMCFCGTMATSQDVSSKFGKGIRFTAKDSSATVKINFRFQSLYSSLWNAEDGLSDYSSNFLTRRARLKFGGFALTPKLKYKMEIGLSNRDVGGGASDPFNNTSKLILDAWFDWNFYKSFSVRVGQAKLPGTRERLISSGSLQFVDRSRLNSRYNIDRDMAIMLWHKLKLGEKAYMKSVISLSQGEGRNITGGNFGANDVTVKLEFYPFGAFQSKGDYVSGAIKYEETPKLAWAFGYDNNNSAARSRGQNGSFLIGDSGQLVSKDLNMFFTDLMFKYRNISLMAEYVDKSTDEGPDVFDEDGNYVGTYFTGTGLNLQAGYMLDKNWELAVRYTDIKPDEGVDQKETQYTFGLSKYIVGHNLKFQTDFTLRDREISENTFNWRVQVEFQF